MFCPQCGAAEQSDRTYCRRCGEWLAQSSAKPQERMKVMMTFNALNSVMALAAAIILYSTYLNTPEAKWSIYVAGALCSVIAVHQLISFVFALGLRLRSRKISEELPPASASTPEPIAPLEARDTHRILDLPSVTENTTEILREASRPGGITKPQG